jgi:hypothetical protein
VLCNELFWKPIPYSPALPPALRLVTTPGVTTRLPWFEKTNSSLAKLSGSTRSTMLVVMVSAALVSA